MNMRRTNKLLFISLTATILIGSLYIVSGAGFMEPGSEEDPIITLSYVEKRLEQIKYYIDQNIETVNSGTATINTNIENINTELQEIKAKVDLLNTGQNNTNVSEAGTSEKFTVVFVEAGKAIILGESAEVIWRSGKATAIASTNGGLSDVTIGKDLQTGEEIPLNHLIIIPRNDGRGMTVTASSYIMVKGSYAIQ